MVLMIQISFFPWFGILGMSVVFVFEGEFFSTCGSLVWKASLVSDRKIKKGYAVNRKRPKILRPMRDRTYPANKNVGQMYNIIYHQISFWYC